MANAFRHIRTVPTECGGKSWLYSTGNHTAEIDTIDGETFFIAECSVEWYKNVVDTTAKSKQTLLNRLDKLFI